MLRALTPDDLPPDEAYRVPWRIDRVHGSHPLLTNDSELAAESVRVFVVGATASQTQRWGALRPGDTVELCLCDFDPESTMFSVAWFHPRTGVEYVWAFVM